ncbi:MAG TPA: hypothetical protein PLL92_11815 [Alicycliphilus sp.]|nr:hypothetical protein [Alicycliphilus sp.]
MTLLSTCRSSLALALGWGLAAAASAQGVPADQWTPQEQQFVQNARTLFEQQGLAYSEDQAAAAVQQMRAKRRAQDTPALKGTPESEWSAQEKAFVQELRTQYQQQGRSLGQEEAQVAVQGMRNQMARLMGTVAAMRSAPQMAATMPAAAPAAAAAASTAATTEAQVAATLAGWPAKPASFVVNERKDGFELNGQVVVDPEGLIINVASDAVSGAITYAVQGSQGVIIKAMSAAEPGRTLVIATGQRTANGWQLQTQTGQRLSGQTVSMLSDGFLVGRDTAAFRYKSGQGVTNVPIPTGWTLAPLQRGDVGSTGYVLLEKDGATGTDSTSSLLSSLQNIAAIVGAARKEDYALLHIGTRKLLPLNIPANGKMIHVHSQCRKRNNFVNECAKMDSFESIYDRDGRRNTAHYYWRAQWVNTPAGPVALTLEDGSGKLYLTNLQSGRKVIALERGLGISSWDMLVHPDGSVGVKGQLGFETREVPDLLALLDTSAAQAQPEPAAPVPQGAAAP